MASRPWTSPHASGTGAEEPDRGATAVQFYVLAFALSWTVWGTAVLFPDLQYVVGLRIILGAYGPFVAALLIAGRREGAWCWFRRVARPKGRWRLMLLGGLALPLLIATAHLVIYTLFFAGVSASSDPPWYWAAAAAPVNICLLFWLGSGMEEFGWQGMGVPALMKRFRPVTTAVVHGIAWGTWHLPLYLIDSWSGNDQSVLALYGITLTLSPIMMWLTRSAAGGVLPRSVPYSDKPLLESLHRSGRQRPVCCPAHRLLRHHQDRRLSDDCRRRHRGHERKASLESIRKPATS